ncbi:hypothetical protein [Actinoplanes sp. NPDC026619]|uniref:hypothetical protein n=1 Tax=Actinoplanes sp. NPDC026619 TaxID=3155798 RepID=UPI0033C13D5C
MLAHEPDGDRIANAALKAVRHRRPSPTRPGQCMSRPELAAAVNDELHAMDVMDSDIDGNYVGKLEQGKIHRPREDYRRVAFRRALRVDGDGDLGFSIFRRSRIDPPLIGGSSAMTAVPQQLEADRPNLDGEENWQESLDALAAEIELKGNFGAFQNALGKFRSLSHIPTHRFSSYASQQYALARWAERLSWICDNDGRDEASIWLSRAYEHAMKADQPHFVAYVLMRQSQRALDAGDARNAVVHIRAALAEPALPRRIQALCMTRLAEAFALAGDDTGLEHAGTAARYSTIQDEDPAAAIARHCDTRYVNAVDGRCRTLLGDHADAVRVLQDVLADETPAPAVDKGLWLTHLAEAYQPSNPQQAAATGQRALILFHQSGSTRIVRALQPLALGLRPQRRIPIVTEFLTAHREALTAGLTG